MGNKRRYKDYRDQCKDQRSGLPTPTIFHTGPQFNLSVIPGTKTHNHS